MMRVTVDKEKINTFDYQLVIGECRSLAFINEISRTGHMSIVKQIMMQAIVYGTLNEVSLSTSSRSVLTYLSTESSSIQLSS